VLDGGETYKNTVTVTGKDDEGTEDSDTDDHTITGTDVAPAIAVDKLVDANGDSIFSDAEWMSPGSHEVTFKYTVTNTSLASTDPLTLKKLLDDNGTPDDATDDINLLAGYGTFSGGDTNDNGLIDRGESWVYTYTQTLDLVDGGPQDPRINTVTAQGKDDEQTPTNEATDTATIHVLTPGVVTNSSLCDFGDTFDLVFTPDMKNWGTTPHYKLSDSNPGQFYYNLFFTPQDVGDFDGEFEANEWVTIDIPYPFVTQGANPLHAYSSVTTNEHGCFVPGTEIFNGGSAMAFTLGQYTDTNADGKVGFGDTYSLTVKLDQLPDGFVYMNLHLDYGLEKQNGWTKSGENAINDPAVNPVLSGISIVEPTSHTFSSSIDGTADNDTIVNDNVFKSVKGFGGMAEIKGLDANRDGDFLDADDITFPVAGAKVELWNKAGTTKLDTAFTDQDGWYFMPNFVHKGKTTDYMVKLVADSAGADGITYAAAQKTTTIGGSDKFGEGYFFVDDTTGTPGVELVGIASPEAFG